MRNKKASYLFYSIVVLSLAAVGILASLYLAVSHYRNYTDISFSSFCAISQSINCDTVSQSPWSIFWGIPLGIWGMVAYGLFFLLAFQALRHKSSHLCLWDVLFFLALSYTIADVYLGYIATIHIHAYCIVCLLTYAASIFLLFTVWLIRRRFSTGSLWAGLRQSVLLFGTSRKTMLIPLLTLVCIVLFKIFLPHYWILEYPAFTADIKSGVNEDGSPWIGAESPALVIHEFADYQCFQCGKMHLFLRSLVNEHPESIRLVHHHYPMDDAVNPILVKSPLHTGSGNLALLAIAAGQQGKFWQANDALYSIARQGLTEFNIMKFAGKLDLDGNRLKQDMYTETSLKKLENDIRQGLQKQIIGTPSYIIDGNVYAGYLPPEVFEKLP